MPNTVMQAVVDVDDSVYVDYNEQSGEILTEFKKDWCISKSTPKSSSGYQLPDPSDFLLPGESIYWGTLPNREVKCPTLEIIEK